MCAGCTRRKHTKSEGKRRNLNLFRPSQTTQLRKSASRMVLGPIGWWLSSPTGRATRWVRVMRRFSKLGQGSFPQNFPQKSNSLLPFSLDFPLPSPFYSSISISHITVNHPSFPLSSTGFLLSSSSSLFFPSALPSGDSHHAAKLPVVFLYSPQLPHTLGFSSPS